MAEKGTKEKKETPAVAEKEFVLDTEKLAADELKTRLRPEDRRFLRELVGDYERLMVEAVGAPNEEKRKEVLKQYGYETELVRRQAEIARLEVEQGRATAQAERLRLQAEAAQAGRQAEELEAVGEAHHIPELYYAAKRRREVRMEEYKKLTTKNWSELVAFFETAFEEKNIPKVEAIVSKLTDDGNENELLNWYGYPATMQGMHDFVNEILIGQLGMGEQEALSFESDISYVAENVGHWEVARIVKKVGGRFVQMTDKEHMLECMIEIGKTPDPRAVARKFNRLAYGGETIVGTAAEYRRGVKEGTADRIFTPSALGVSILVAYGAELLGRWGEVNFNLKQKMAGFILANPQNRQFLIDAGVSEDVVKKFGSEAEAGRIITNTLELRDRIFRAKEKHGM